MQVQSYLFFNGRCEEAIEFYQRAIGAKVEMLMRHKDVPGRTLAEQTTNPRQKPYDARVIAEEAQTLRVAA